MRWRGRYVCRVSEAAIGCIFQASVVDDAVLKVVKTDFGLSTLNEAAIQVETLDGAVIGLAMNFPLRKSLSSADLAAMAMMVKLAAGREDSPF